MTLRTTLLSLALLPLVACGKAFPTNADTSSNDNVLVSMGDGADNDGDGYGERVDCDDSNADINPGEEELCADGIDNDCDGEIDGEDSNANRAPHCFDGDGDGFCEDYNGNGELDEGDTVQMCESSDADIIAEQTNGDVSETANYIEVEDSGPPLYEYPAADCDDEDASTYPAAPEACDGLDNDCDASTPVDESALMGPWYADADGDNFGNALDMVAACDMPTGYVADDTDCDDADANTWPGAPEFCDDGLDNDCDASTPVDESAMTGSWYADGDSDGFGAGAVMMACDMPMGFVDNDGDCDDEDGAINPAAQEVCDDMDVDEDCDAMADDADDSVDADGYTQWYSDADGDTFAGTDAGMSCDDATGMLSTVNDDCDDGNEDINPDAIEVEDGGIDNDCDGLADAADPGVVCFDSIEVRNFLTDDVDTITLSVSDAPEFDGEVYMGSVPGVSVSESTSSTTSVITIEFEHCLDADTVISLDVAYADGTHGCEVSGPAHGAIRAYEDITELDVNDGADDGSGTCMTEITEPV